MTHTYTHIHTGLIIRRTQAEKVANAKIVSSVDNQYFSYSCLISRTFMFNMKLNSIKFDFEIK